ncbi:hypothetical protein [Hwangdonia sp.]|uniref:hypothetical protein n=1 Tax=Hwangdonia sp. TaxID=1883432 RepID=UPI003AB8366F
MKIKTEIKKEVSELIDEANLILEFLQAESKEEGFSFHMKYQSWYSKALKVVEILASDRYNEFKSFYEIDPKRKTLGYGTYVIQDYIKNVSPRGYSNFDADKQVLICFYNQYTILISLASRIDNILSNIESTLLSEIQEDELSSAKQVMKVSLRASGAICGVIIEGHLQMVAKNHNLTIRKKNPTISNLNELLKEKEIYDVTHWRKISYLGDIRNICSHKKDIEPTKEQILELIEGTNWLMKTIN